MLFALTQKIAVTIRLHPIGAAPQLRQKVFRISASNRFETVVIFLRKKLGAEHGAVFCYVNSVFAPGLDEGVGNLWRVSGVWFSFLFLSGVGG